MPEESANFIFPFVNGFAKLGRKGWETRTPDRIRQDIEEREEHRSELQGEKDEPDSAEQQTEQDELETKHDFWSISRSFIYRHHLQERQTLCVPQESSFPVPLKYIDVVRQTHATLDVLLDVLPRPPKKTLTNDNL